MKNLMRAVVALTLIFTMMTPLGMPVFGTDSVPLQTTTTENSAEPQALDLILTCKLDARKIDDSRMYVDIDLSCFPTVVKCGIKSVHLQKRKNSSESWKNDLSLDDYLVDGYSFTKRITFGATGYQFRLIATFYAKKAWYSIQKIDSASNVVTMY